MLLNLCFVLENDGVVGTHHILLPESAWFADLPIGNLPAGILQRVRIFGLVPACIHQTDLQLRVLYRDLIHLSFCHVHVHVHPPGLGTGTAVERGVDVVGRVDVGRVG